MQKQKLKNRFSFKLSKLSLVLTAIVIAFATIATTGVLADQLQQRINDLEETNSQRREEVDELQQQASSYKDAINKLQNKINALESAIDQNQQKQARLHRQIIDVQKQIDEEKHLLGESIRALYVQGQITTIEMLASSENLSDFVDKQVYHSAVRDKIKGQLDKITELKLELQKQKDKVEALIKDLKSQQDDLAAAKAKQNDLLGYNQEQQATFNQKISNTQKKIDELRRQQAIENARLFGNGLIASGNCGGGYPKKANGPWGNWGCNYPLDYNIDNWGMYNRECVSYTAYRVAASGRHMPYWGGHGNANQWDDNARASGIPVSGTPKYGDVAISNAGFYGHAMYVEAVYGDGTILISQFNGDWQGNYSMARINIGSLVFIHFR